MQAGTLSIYQLAITEINPVMVQDITHQKTWLMNYFLKSYCTCINFTMIYIGLR